MNIPVYIALVITSILNYTTPALTPRAKGLVAWKTERNQNINLNAATIINEISAIIGILKPHDQNTEDISLNVTELALKHGFLINQYEVMTSDGYILTIFRIPSTGRPVLLTHGLFCSAEDWLIAGPNSGLAYMLALAGFDVWMANTRGNKYSRRHISLSPEDEEFWQFSFDEVGRYDLPATIDFILNNRNETQLAYIGHSQGTTAFFVLCSEKPYYNDKISVMVALAPLAWVYHMDSPLLQLIAPYTKWSWILKLLNYHELAPKNNETIPALCELGNGLVCVTALFLVYGFDYEQVNITNTASVFGHLQSGASLNQVVHYLQNVVSKNFLKFDHGRDKNEEIYGTSKPSQYLVENIDAPVALMYSDNDWISNLADILKLKKKLQNVVTLYRVPFKKFNHLDFLYAKNVKKLLYSRVLNILETATWGNGQIIVPNSK